MRGSWAPCTGSPRCWILGQKTRVGAGSPRPPHPPHAVSALCLPTAPSQRPPSAAPASPLLSAAASFTHLCSRLSPHTPGPHPSPRPTPSPPAGFSCLSSLLPPHSGTSNGDQSCAPPSETSPARSTPLDPVTLRDRPRPTPSTPGSTCSASTPLPPRLQHLGLKEPAGSSHGQPLTGHATLTHGHTAFKRDCCHLVGPWGALKEGVQAACRVLCPSHSWRSANCRAPPPCPYLVLWGWDDGELRAEALGSQACCPPDGRSPHRPVLGP